MLTLISEETDHYVYETPDGDEVLLAGQGPIFRTVVMWEDFDLEAAWADARQAAQQVAYWNRPELGEFVEKVRESVADPDAVEIVWCDDCREAMREEGANATRDGVACDPCYEEYSSCEDCGELLHCDDIQYVGDRSVCRDCISSSYSWCEHCDTYYHESDDEDHAHGGCDCESPAQVFAMRNDGEPILNQDERVTIALPSGVISAEGIDSIAALVRNHGHHQEDYEDRCKWWSLSAELEDALGNVWQTKEGNYTKRLSKLAHKSHGLKFPPELLSKVGCIARDNSTGVDFAVEVTRDLNLPAEEFYHEESCWWQSYSESRCSLKQNGGIGMRTFGGHYGDVQGRAWIMPLREDEDGDLHPTFDSLTPDAFMVFNGYGDLSGYTPARIVSHMAGMTYRKIGFQCSPMYVNGNTGYLVASEEIAARYASKGSLRIYPETHSDLFHRETRDLVLA